MATAHDEYGLVREAAARALLFGYWGDDENDLDRVLLDDHLTTIPGFKDAFAQTLKDELDRFYSFNKVKAKKVIARYWDAFEVIHRQVEWAMKIREISKLQLYLELANMLSPYLTRALKHHDKSMSSDESLKWLEYRRKFGESVSTFLGDILSRPPAKNATDLCAELEVLRAVVAVDNVALPQLESADAGSEEAAAAEKALFGALEVLHNVSGYKVRSADVNYWRSKCYRHLAMAAIKQLSPRRALMRLATSGFFIRHVRDRSNRDELSQELLRGYAEVHHLMKNVPLVKEFLQGTPYKVSQIGNYIPENVALEEAYDEVNARFRLILVRHQERETDQEKRFGFGGKITERGQREFHYIVDTLGTIVSSDSDEVPNISDVVIATNSDLEGEAKDLKSHLCNSRSGTSPEVRVAVHDKWKSIDVGEFRGLTEVEAKNHDPGVYHVLDLYRMNRADGFELEFPKGESVRAFEERIAVQLAELLDDLSGESTEEELATGLPTRAVVFYGHTSTVTAVLNLCNVFRQRDLTECRYEFHPIQTGTVVRGDIDFKLRSWIAHESRLSN